MSLAYGRLFSKWEINLAKKLIREYRRSYKALAKELEEDLLQECLTHLYYARRKIPPEEIRSNKSLVANVIKKKLNQIVRDHKRHKRLVTSLTENLDEIEDLEEASSIDPREHLYKTELRTDLEKAFQKLNPIQKEICRLIIEEGLNPTDIARHLQIDRGTVYYELKLIRKIFQKEGMEEYLK
jgi:RNA polymerase sigma factor (sigma-70 family)